MKHKVVLVGAGYFGQRHLKVLSEIEDVEIVGVVDKEIEKAQAIAEPLGVNFSNQINEFIDAGRVFFIVTPTNTHYEIAKELIEKGKDLFIEKPMVETPEQALELFEQAERSGIIIQVGLIERFNPVFRKLLNEINTPLHIQARRESPFHGRALDTDVTFDLMIHDLDLLWFILRKIKGFRLKSLKTFTQSLLGKRIDFANIWLEIESAFGEIKVNLTANRISSDSLRTFTVVDKDGVFYADLLRRKIFKTTKDGQLQEIAVKDSESQPLYLEIRDFFQAVRTRIPSEIAPSPEEVIEVIRIIDRINGGD